MPTKTERMNYHYMADAMRRFDWDMHQAILSERRIPPEWHAIAKERVSQRKRPVSIRLEEDVLRFFRSMGPNYGPRMNEVLRAFMHARLAGVLRGVETMDYLRDTGDRPDWGSTQAEAETLGPIAAAELREAVGVPLRAERESAGEKLERLRAARARRDGGAGAARNI